MSVVRAKIQTVEEIYRLVWAAVSRRRPIEAIYDGRPRLFCPHRLGRNRTGELRVLCYQYGGESKSGLEARFSGKLALHRLEKFRQVKLLDDDAGTAPNHSVPASCVVDADMTPRINQVLWSRRRGIEATVRAGGGRWLVARWQSSADYAVRDEPGDPRGRKFGGDSGADNPTWPARTEGEKRFRSATRNP
jgi:hypothetical protein